MKPLVVVNPTSGGGATGRTWRAMRGTIEAALGPVEVATTERAGHATDLAREAALAGHPLVIAIGGDGTIHEAVNGLMQAKAGGYGTKADAVQLGIIGQGTGGDFRKSLGLEHRLDRYLDAIKSGHETPIDVGKFTGGGKATHYFVNILSAGMGGLVDQYVRSSSRLLGGKAAYFGASLRALVGSRVGHVILKVTRDGKTEEHRLKTLMLAVCNGRYFGAGMHIGPMAKLDDGLLDVVVLGETSKLAFSALSRVIYDGKHIGQPGNAHLVAERVELDLANEDARGTFLLDVDGEPMGPLPVTIEVVPKALVVRA